MNDPYGNAHIDPVRQACDFAVNQIGWDPNRYWLLRWYIRQLNVNTFYNAVQDAEDALRNWSVRDKKKPTLARLVHANLIAILRNSQPTH